jgi:hypothetical protein
MLYPGRRRQQHQQDDDDDDIEDNLPPIARPTVGFNVQIMERITRRGIVRYGMSVGQMVETIGVTSKAIAT